MAAGRCCITTDCDGQKDIVKNGETGLLFPVGNYTRLTNLITKCYKDDGYVQKIGLQAKMEMKNRSWETVSDEVVDYVLKNS